MSEPASLRVIVRGRVQGVGFRFFVQNHGRKLGLSGYTRNLSNGSVEVVGEGSQTALEALLAHLRQGPSMSRVEGVDVSWMAATGEYEGFVIR